MKQEAPLTTSPALSPVEIAFFQAVAKPAVVLLLLLRLDRPAGSRELADILGLDEHTVAKYLRQLEQLHLVARGRYRRGYHLVGDLQRLFAPGLTVKNPQVAPATTTDQINQNKEKIDSAVTAVEPRLRDLSPADCNTVQALLTAGIGEPKRSSLARLAYMTPDYIQSWQAHLKYVKGEKYRTGLLIHVLETGDPAPEVRQNGHPLECTCRECHPVEPIICPQCCQYPCSCEGEQFV